MSHVVFIDAIESQVTDEDSDSCSQEDSEEEVNIIYIIMIILP